MQTIEGCWNKIQTILKRREKMPQEDQRVLQWVRRSSAALQETYIEASRAKREIHKGTRDASLRL